MVDMTHPLNQTRMEGPFTEYEHPDGYWTAEFGAAIDSVRQGEADAVHCPVCNQPLTNVETHRVYGMRDNLNTGMVEFAGGIGWLWTLHPCGHTISQ